MKLFLTTMFTTLIILSCNAETDNISAGQIASESFEYNNKIAQLGLDGWLSPSENAINYADINSMIQDLEKEIATLKQKQLELKNNIDNFQIKQAPSSAIIVKDNNISAEQMEAWLQEREAHQKNIAVFASLNRTLP